MHNAFDDALIAHLTETLESLGADPATSMKVYAINGRFGAYVQLGENPEKGSKEKPKRSSWIASARRNASS